MDNELQVDHLTLTLELLTKAYEQFKISKSKRINVFIASEIAMIYETSGKFDIALKFYERISKSYRKDGWLNLLASVCRRMFNCALKCGNSQVVMDSTLEQLAISRAENVNLIHDNINGISYGAEVAMDQITSFITCSIQFDVALAHIDGASPTWQLCFSNQKCHLPIGTIITRIEVNFSDPAYNHRLEAIDEVDSESNIIFRDGFRSALHNIEGNEVWVDSMDLRLIPGRTICYQHAIIPKTAQDLFVDSVRVHIQSSRCQFTLLYKISKRSANDEKRFWISSELDQVFVGNGSQSSIRIEQRKPKVLFDVKLPATLYFDEFVPLVATATNLESEEIKIVVQFRYASQESERNC